VPALRMVMERMDGAAAQVMLSLQPLLESDNDLDQRADALVGVANIAGLLKDEMTEQRALESSIESLRQIADEQEARKNLYDTLRRLAAFHFNRDRFEDSLPLLEEVVMLGKAISSPVLAQDRVALATARRRASGQSDPTLRDLIEDWAEGRDEAQLAQLLNLICQMTVAALQGGALAGRVALNDDLARLRALQPLPLAGANDFLRVLQAWLRGAPGQAAEIARVRASLPDNLAGALNAMERNLDGEEMASEPAEEGQPSQAEMVAMLEAMTPEQRAELQIIQKVANILQQAAGVLHDPQATTRELTENARAVERVADQAAEGEEDGSPWLDGAAALRAVAARLRGQPVDPSELTPVYQQILAQLGVIAPGAEEENE
jgi:hypothetical protein